MHNRPGLLKRSGLMHAYMYIHLDFQGFPRLSLNMLSVITQSIQKWHTFQKNLKLNPNETLSNPKVKRTNSFVIETFSDRFIYEPFCTAYSTIEMLERALTDKYIIYYYTLIKIYYIILILK